MSVVSWTLQLGWERRLLMMSSFHQQWQIMGEPVWWAAFFSSSSIFSWFIPKLMDRLHSFTSFPPHPHPHSLRLWWIKAAALAEALIERHSAFWSREGGEGKNRRLAGRIIMPHRSHVTWRSDYLQKEGIRVFFPSKTKETLMTCQEHCFFLSLSWIYFFVCHLWLTEEKLTDGCGKVFSHQSDSGFYWEMTELWLKKICLCKVTVLHRASRGQQITSRGK